MLGGGIKSVTKGRFLVLEEEEEEDFA